MRCLVVTPDQTHPQDEDERVRAHALLARLKAFGHVVDVVLASRGTPDADGLRAMREAWDRLVVVPSASDTPADAFPPALEPALRDLAARGSYDVVIARRLHLGRTLGFFPPGTVKVMHLSGAAATPDGLQHADLVLAPDDDARAATQVISRAPVATLAPAPPAVARSAPSTAPGGGFRIGLAATADAPSVEAVAGFLAESDLERLAARGGVLRVSGPVAARLGGARRGLVLSPLRAPPEDLDLVVCPVPEAQGPGTSVVEALARGLPVIGTAAAFRGLPARSPFHAAPGPRSLAGLLRRWLASAELRATVAADGADLAARHRADAARQHAPFRDAPALRASLRRPRALAVGDATAEDGRIADLLRAAGGVLDVDLLLLGEAGDPAPAAPGTRGRVIRIAATAPDGKETGTPDESATLAAARAALPDAGHDILLLSGEHLSFLRPLGRPAALRVLDADVAQEPLPLECWERRSRFDLVLTRDPGQQRVARAVLPRHAWYLPGPDADRPCPDRAAPVGRLLVRADATPAGIAGVVWFLGQVWPAIAAEGAACHVSGGAARALPPVLPPGVVLAAEDAESALDAADLAVDPVADGALAPLTRDFLLRGLPSVLSPTAARGLPAGEGTAFLVARSRTECVAHLQRLLREPARRRSMGEAAFRLGRTLYGPAVASAAARGLADLAATAARAA